MYVRERGSFPDFQPVRAASKDGDSKTGDQTDTITRIDKPRMFKVLLHNDDYTSMEFVVEVLMTVFKKTRVEATRVMLIVHKSGMGIAGVYTREVAEARTAQAVDMALAAGFPLMVTSEPE